jgi:small ligand-binding sensory domain FIST
LLSGQGDMIKGFGWSGNFGNPNTLVFEVTALGDVHAHSFNSDLVVTTSDRNAKENLKDISPTEVLQKVVSMPITEWNFKGDTETEHIGPMAQDFHAAFGLDGSNDKGISTTDEGGVALAAIQGLNQELQEQLRQKDAAIRDLQSRLERLEKLMAKSAGKAENQ